MLNETQKRYCFNGEANKGFKIRVQPRLSVHTKGSESRRINFSGLFVLAFFAAHVPIAFSIRAYPLVGLFHFLCTLGVGLWWTAFRRHAERVAYIGAYISGAEVMWRMSHTPIFWEVGKYAMAAIFIISIVARRHFKAPALPVLYFALLLPSAALTTSSMDFQAAQNQLSFNLSGPFALMIGAWFFSQIELSRRQIFQLFLAFIGPVVGVFSIAAFSTLAAQELHFTTQSNFVTSGGFGPVQVSAVLGLGSLMAYLYALDKEVTFNLRLLMIGIIVILGTQSALTFSRNGLYNAAISATAGSLFLIRNRRAWIRFAVIVAILFLIANYVLLPRLESLTSGLIKARFENPKPTGRYLIAKAELEAWQENPILGLGPGGAAAYRHQRTNRVMSSHSEYTRLLGEHGVLGLEALLLLLIMAIRNVSRTKTPENKMMMTSLVAWSLLFMAGVSMRLVAASFIFGLGFVNFLPQARREVQSRKSRGTCQQN